MDFVGALCIFAVGVCAGLFLAAWLVRSQYGGTTKALDQILRGGGPGEEG